jgi:hypothetical protein
MHLLNHNKKNFRPYFRAVTAYACNLPQQKIAEQEVMHHAIKHMNFLKII